MTETRMGLVRKVSGLLCVAASLGVHAEPTPTITARQTDAFQVDLDSNGVVNQGDTIRYTIRIDNEGDSDGVNVALREFLDANTTLVAGSLKTSPIARDDAFTFAMGRELVVPGPGVLTNDSDADGDTLYVGAFNPVSRQGFPVTMKADGTFAYKPPPDFYGSDFFSYSVADDDGMVNDARVFVTVEPRANVVVGMYDENDPVSPGDAITYRINVENLGPAPAVDAVLLDAFPPGTVFVSTTWTNITMTSNSLTCILGTLPAATAVKFTVTLKAPGAGSVVTNRIVAESNTTDTDPSNNTAEETTVVNEDPVTGGDRYEALGNVSISVPAVAGVLTNDYDPDGLTLAVSAFEDPSVAGGTVHVDTHGGFTYDPPPGFTGKDGFSYTVTDVHGATSVGAVSIYVQEMVWFVDGLASPGGDGRLSAPFDALADVSAAGDPDDKGEIIFVATAKGVAYAGGIELEDDQALIGQGVDFAAASGLVLPPFSDPLPDDAGPAVIDGAPAVLLARNNTVRGIAVRTVAGAGILGSDVGALTVSDTSVDATGGAGLDVDDGNVSIGLQTVVVHNAAGNGIRLSNVTGTTTLGSLTVVTREGTGLLLSKAGTFNLADASATVSSSGGPALEIDNTSGQVNGLPGWAFASVVSTDSPRDGVTFDTVAQDITLRNLDIVNPVGDGLEFSAITADVTLERGRIDGNGSDNHGLHLAGVTGKTMVLGQNAANPFRITNVGTAIAGLGGHSGIQHIGSGDLEVRFVDFDDIGSLGDEHGINLERPIPGARSVMVSGCRFANIGHTVPGNPATGAGNGVDLDVPTSAAYVGLLTVTLTDNVFRGNGTDFQTTDTAVNLDFQAGANATLQATVSNNDIDGVRSGINVLIAGAAGTGANGRNVVRIADNTGDDFDNDGINVDVSDDAGGIGGGDTRLIVSNNVLNAITAYTASGHDPDEAIEVELRGVSSASGNLSVAIINNTIGGASNNPDERWDNNGITVGTAGNVGLNATISATIADNTVNFCENAGILLKADESATLNVRVTGNTLQTTGEGIRLKVEDDPFTLLTYFQGNVPGSGGWSLEDNANVASVWELGVTAPHVQIGNTLVTPSANGTLAELLEGESNLTTDLVFDSGAVILIVDQSTIPGGL